ncbi:hypothetical protein [Devosia sp. RR2S18]|uniref:hypothetical protein n=1 Tax=Devosia rhizosphaerae TaxID=3049774 RepID=UPI002542125F|nr:hypothetical protein [Devosia sp. RR2S18]WIJ26582.1 hypothetical protein QOV41_07480 [Devosia sp. RR2S18]
MNPVIPQQQASTALRRFTVIPDGCRAVQVRRHHQGSAYRMGMFVIVDPDDTTPAADADFLVQWNEFSRPTMIGVRIIRDEWFVGPAGGGHSVAHHNDVSQGSFPIVMVDGPYRTEHLQAKLLGRVLGYLGHEDGEPIEALWHEHSMEGPNRDTFGLEHLPEDYCCNGEGRCLEPVYADGTRFQFTSREPVAPGDYVVLWRKPELTRQTHRQALIKRLASPLPEGWAETEHWTADDPMPPVVLVEMHNPPRTYAVAADELMAVHKCVATHDGPRSPVSKDQLKAIAARQRAERERVA